MSRLEAIGETQRATLGLGLIQLSALVIAVLLLHDRPMLYGTALLAYGLGARHALDVDHIAAIDNVTRSLMQKGQRPVTVGLWFSLGHSLVVLLVTLLTASFAAHYRSRLLAFQSFGESAGPLISSAFLLIVAAVNLRLVLRMRTRLPSGAPASVPFRGWSRPWVRGLMQHISRPVLMFPVGVAFGLGFDTASEIALLSISATEVARGLPLFSLLAFPIAFAASMGLVDTADSLLMVRAYGWARYEHRRHALYNVAVTSLSALAAIAVAVLQLGRAMPEWSGRFMTSLAASVDDHSALLGGLMVAGFAAALSALYGASVFGKGRRSGGTSPQPLSDAIGDPK